MNKHTQTDEEFVAQVTRVLNPALNDLAAKLWEKHPNNPKNKVKTVPQLRVRLTVPNEHQQGVINLVESLEGHFTTDTKFVGGMCEVEIDTDCMQALELALPCYKAAFVSSQPVLQKFILNLTEPVALLDGGGRRIIYKRAHPYGAPLLIIRGGGTLHAKEWFKTVKSPVNKGLARVFSWDDCLHGWTTYMLHDEVDAMLEKFTQAGYQVSKKDEA
jgi:hypothetical protein